MTAHPEKREAILRAYALLNAMRIEPVEVDHQALVEFAEETGLTACDASYLWLARALSAELITLERRLSRAAARLPW